MSTTCRPADPAARRIAEQLRSRHWELPIVCASIYPDFEQLGSLLPVDYLIKPFGLNGLERALCAAVDSVDRPAKLAS